MSQTAQNGVLSGLRVLELGHFVAAPFCTRLLADLGADVIKVEPPGAGDPVRQWGAQVDGKSVWWSLHGRNKRSVTLNLKHPEAAGIVLRLVAGCDALVENFRPGQLAKLGLGEEALKRVRPDLVIARISGFGQDGPYRNRAAFGVIGEAMGGLRHLTNHPSDVSDLPPVRVGVSIGDSLAGLYAAFGVMAALWQRDRAGGDRRGRDMDVALTDSVLSLMEGLLPEYGLLGTVKQPTGSRIATAAPSNAYPTLDGGWILVAGNSDPLFARLAALIGRPELATDPRFAGNRARVQNVEELDRIVAAWTRQHTAAEVDRALTEADIPCTQVYTAAEIATDPQFRHSGMVQEVEDPRLGRLLHPGAVPRIPGGPGAVRWPGPAVGAHTEEVFTELLGLAPAEVVRLRQGGGDLMDGAMQRAVEIVEVGPRDGYQGIGPFIPTEVKIQFLEKLAAAGLRRIEIGSFVSASALPQMRDTPEVLAACQRLPGVDAQVLVPSERRGRDAVEAGARRLVFVLSVSEAHNRSNVRRHPLESAQEYERLLASLPPGVGMRLDIATAFDCPFTGRVPEEATFALLDRLIPLRPDAELCLCDTTGRVAPDHVAGLFARAMARFPQVAAWAFHGHDTYGLGLANVNAAYREGVRVFDASFGGLGGCPFAPGATGNVATEDVVWMFERMGVATGINLDALLPAAREAAALPGAQPGGRVRDALSARLDAAACEVARA